MNNISVSHSNKYNKTETESNILGHTDKFNASEFIASQLEDKNGLIENINKSKLTSDEEIDIQNIQSTFLRNQEPLLNSKDLQQNIK